MVEKKTPIFISLSAIALSLLAHAGMWVSLSPQKDFKNPGSFSISIREERIKSLENETKEKKIQQTEDTNSKSENNIISEELGQNDIKIIYPKRSRQLEEEGKTVLSFYIDQWGKAQNINIVQSSGYERLDSEAFRAVKETFFSVKEVEKEIAIEFKLKETP